MRTAILVALFRAGASLGNLLLILVVARMYEIEVVGVVSLAIATGLGVSTVSRLGFDVAAIKHLPPLIANGRWPAVRAFYASFGSRTVLLLTFVLMLWGVTELGRKTDWISVVVLSSGMTSLAFMSALVKSMLKPVASSAYELGYPMLFATVVLLAAEHYAGKQFSAVDVLRLISGAVAAYVIVAGIVLGSTIARSRREESRASNSIDFRTAHIESISFFLITLAGYFYAQGYVWLAGQLFDLTSVAFVAIAARLVLAVNFSMMIANTIYNPRFSLAVGRRDFENVEILASQSLRMMLAISALPCALLIVCPTWILGFFNIQSDVASNCLVMMAAAQLVNVATGNASAILNLTGGEQLVRNTVLVHVAAAIVVSVIGAGWFGVDGVVGTFAAALASQNVMLVVILRQRYGINLYRHMLQW